MLVFQNYFLDNELHYSGICCYCCIYLLQISAHEYFLPFLAYFLAILSRCFCFKLHLRNECIEKYYYFLSYIFWKTKLESFILYVLLSEVLYLDFGTNQVEVKYFYFSGMRGKGENWGESGSRSLLFSYINIP